MGISGDMAGSAGVSLVLCEQRIFDEYKKEWDRDRQEEKKSEDLYFRYRTPTIYPEQCAQIRMSLAEYIASGVRVGDRVSVEVVRLGS